MWKIILVIIIIFLIIKTCKYRSNYKNIENFNTNNKIIFSIIIPLYNNEIYINNTIMSIINQSFKNFEIIVIDDKSSDNSYKKVKNLQKKYKNIRLFKNDKNLGTYKSLNKGIILSNGKYITCLGSDDIFDKNRLFEDYKGLQKKTIVISGYTRKDELTNKLYGRFKYGESMISFNKLIIKDIGFYLNCRFGGDTEFLDRIKIIYGNNGIYKINKILYYAIIKKNKKNLTIIHNSNTRKKFRRYYQNLHKNYNTNITQNVNNNIKKDLTEILISEDDHNKNLDILKIKII
uniref:Glycosyltransferase 2-like domain-containing protein n=1 Tax=viral metagenome TaxID=1070528 RepID=A0A6C0J5S3_9ZZZZ